MQETQLLTSLVPQLGMAGIFLGLLVVVWKYFQSQVEKKDEQLRNVNEKVLTAFVDNTRVMESLKNATDANTKATQTLSDNVFEAIRRK